MWSGVGGVVHVVVVDGVNGDGVSGVSGCGAWSGRLWQVLHLPPVDVAGGDWCWG